MNFFLFIILVFILLFVMKITTDYFRSLKESGLVLLEAKTSHNNRGLQFTKGKKYNFYKNGSKLMINYDDISNDRDNYVFYKEDLEAGFLATTFYSKFVLKNIHYYYKGN